METKALRQQLKDFVVVTYDSMGSAYIIVGLKPFFKKDRKSLFSNEKQEKNYLPFCSYCCFGGETKGLDSVFWSWMLEKQ